MIQSLKYVTNTWLLAHALHPVIFYIYFLDPASSMLSLFSIEWLSIVISLPGYVTGILLFYQIRSMPLSALGIFFLTMLVAFLAIIFSCIVLAVFLTDLYKMRMILYLSVPAVISVFLSVLIRYSQLNKAIKLNHDETFN